MHLLDLFKIISLFTDQNRGNPHPFLKLRPVKKDTPSGWSLQVLQHMPLYGVTPHPQDVPHSSYTYIKGKKAMQAVGVGVGGSQIFSLRSRQNFNPSNPLSWQKKSTIHFSKGPTKTERVPIPSILGKIHFLSAQAPILQLPPPLPQRMAGSCIGEFRFAFSKKATIFLSCGQLFQTCHQKVNPSECTNKILGICSGKSFMFHFPLVSKLLGVMLRVAREKSSAPIIKAGFH